MTRPFGQSSTAWLYPLVGDEAYSPALTSGNLVAAYLFKAEPTLDEARDGTGTLVGVSITSWTWDADKGAFGIVVPPVPDPEPDSVTGSSRTYTLAVNWRLEAAQQIQTTFLTLAYERPRAHASALSVVPADVETYYPDVAAYATDSQLLAYIAQAQEDVRTKLRDRGFKWAGVTRPERLKQVVVLRTLYMLMLAQAQASGDKFYGKFTEYRAMFTEALDGLRFEYDADGDGTPDLPEGGTGPGGIGVIYVER